MRVLVWRDAAGALAGVAALSVIADRPPIRPIRQLALWGTIGPRMRGLADVLARDDVRAEVLDGFANLFSLLVEETFTVENPFLWLTKTEVVNLIGDAGCGELIGQSVSCTHTREQTTEKPHCGRCSQCISRKFATLASRFSSCDPGNLYHLDLLTDPRTPEKDRTLVESFIRKADAKGLDASCLERIPRPLFMLPLGVSSEPAPVRARRK